MPKFKIEKKNGLNGKWERWGYIEWDTPRQAKDDFMSITGPKRGSFRLLDPNDRIIDLRG